MKTENIVIYSSEISDVSEVSIEHVRAKKIDRDIYKITSVPSCCSITGYNLGDIVKTYFDSDQKELVFEKMLLKSESKLIRIYCYPDQKCRKYLNLRGCTIKSHSPASINVPAKVFKDVESYIIGTGYDYLIADEVVKDE